MSQQTLRQSKTERRDQAREKAKAQRQAQQRRDRRRRLLLQGGIVAAIVVVVVVVAVGIVNSGRPPGPGPANMADDGVLLSGSGMAVQRTGALAAGATPDQRAPQAGKIAIRVYEDFGCPFCQEFEQTNGSYIEQLVTSGRATLQIYPVAIRDVSFQGTKYSTRAANAAAAVAQYSPAAFYAFHGLLYAHQPAESTSGLTDAQLIAYVKQSGATDLGDITDAIRSGRFENWVGDATQRFVDADFALTNVHSVNDYVKAYDDPNVTGIGTPTIFVGGKLYTGSVADKSAFSAAVAATDAYSASPSASPSPSPSATR